MWGCFFNAKNTSGGNKMYGTVTYFTEYFKAMIMNNFVVDQALPLQACFTQIQQEIHASGESEEQKKLYFINVERAFKKVSNELRLQKEE